MKSSVFSRIHLQRALQAAIATLLLSAWPVLAGEKQPVSSVGYLLRVDMGQWTTLPSGNIHISGITFVFRMESSNPLGNGLLTVALDFEADGDLNGAGHGTGRFETGTWDAQGFHSTGGLILTTVEGVGNLFGENTLHAIGHGVAGEVKGWIYRADYVPGTNPPEYSGWLLDPHATK